MGYQDIEESRIYQRAERVADQVWDVVIQWNIFTKDTVGKQLCRAIDSIGANIAESAGRYSPKDVIRFLHYARGSLRETRFWLKRANKRQLITNELSNQLMRELNQLGAELNNYINFQRTRKIKEPTIEYQTNKQTNQPTNKLTNQQTNQPTNQPTNQQRSPHHD